MTPKKLKDIGEFGLIELLRKRTPKSRSVVLGIGDDTAVLKRGPKTQTLFTTDMLIEGRHFKRSQATAYQIGWKALAVNVSDIAAMGGKPTYAVVSVGLPSHLHLNFVKDLYRGIQALAKRCGICVVGGDTNQSKTLVIAISLLGEVSKKHLVSRRGAKPGDIVFVTGTLGGSYTSKKHLTFVPRLKESHYLVQNFKVSAMMDLSDGLASDMDRIAQSSRVGAVLSKERIPISRRAKNFNKTLSEGEDFELLFTMSPEEAARLMQVSRKPKGLTSFHPIGLIVDKKHGVQIVDKKGNKSSCFEKGFDHFKR